MAAVTENAVRTYFSGETYIGIAHLTVTSGETYTPTAITGKTLKVLSCYNGSDGASVVCTISSGVITMGNAQSLSDEDTMLTYTFI